LSTLLHATVYMFLHNLLNVLVQIANKMGLQKKSLSRLSMQCGTLNVSHPYRLPRPITNCFKILNNLDCLHPVLCDKIFDGLTFNTTNTSNINH
jgi:hypothetical protein